MPSDRKYTLRIANIEVIAPDDARVLVPWLWEKLGAPGDGVALMSVVDKRGVVTYCGPGDSAREADRLSTLDEYARADDFRASGPHTFPVWARGWPDDKNWYTIFDGPPDGEVGTD